MQEEKSRGGNLFGEFVKNRRMELRLTLRSFCLEVGINAGNFSKIERGKLSPPQDKDKLEKWAEVLKIEKNSPAWAEFLDFASISAGKIPEEVMNDEELLKIMPLIFRTVGGNRMTEEQFEKLKELIRRS